MSKKLNLPPDAPAKLKIKPKTSKKWGNLLKGSKKQQPATALQSDILQDTLSILKDSDTKKPSGFRRLLADENAVPKDTGDQRLLRSAKVLERMIIQDANIDIAFGKSQIQL